MSCCDQCKWHCAACCWNSERQTSMNRKKKTDTSAAIRRHTRTHPRRRRDTPAPCPHLHAPARPRAPGRPKTTTTVFGWDFLNGLFFNFSNFKKLLRHFKKELLQKTTKKKLRVNIVSTIKRLQCTIPPTAECAHSSKFRSSSFLC